MRFLFTFILFVSCVPNTVNFHRKGYLDGCVVGSRKFIELSIRSYLPPSQVAELKKICVTFYESVE